MDNEMLFNLSYTQIMHKYESEWQHIEKQMRSSGASEEEVKGVLATARNHFSSRNDSECYIYGVPIRTKRIRLKFKPVWIIGFGWGVGWPDPRKGGVEPPNHVRVLAIGGRKPYKELCMETCN